MVFPTAPGSLTIRENSLSLSRRFVFDRKFTMANIYTPLAEFYCDVDYRTLLALRPFNDKFRSFILI